MAVAAAPYLPLQPQAQPRHLQAAERSAGDPLRALQGPLRHPPLDTFLFATAADEIDFLPDSAEAQSVRRNMYFHIACNINLL